MRSVLLVVLVYLLLTSCSGEYIEKKGEVLEAYVVPGPRGYGFRDVVRICFENEGVIDTVNTVYKTTRLNKGDSVLFSLNVKNPRKSIVRRVTYRHDGSEAYIPIDTTKEKLYQYYVIDKKPLFKEATDYMKNDSLVQEFLKTELLHIQGTISGRMAIYLIIDEQGKAFVEDILMADETTESNLREIVENMPLFEPGEHKGEKVKVSYLVEIK